MTPSSPLLAALDADHLEPAPAPRSPGARVASRGILGDTPPPVKPRARRLEPACKGQRPQSRKHGVIAVRVLPSIYRRGSRSVHLMGDVIPPRSAGLGGVACRD